MVRSASRVLKPTLQLSTRHMTVLLTRRRNAPFVFGVRSAATAIATGNTAILKASEMTPRCYWAIGKAFHDAGLPAGVLNVISCSAARAAEVVGVIIEHPAVRKINFTGSAAVGRKVARVCGENLKPCVMELGGKNSTIVLEDADLEKAAEACLAGAFLNVRLTFFFLDAGKSVANESRRARSAWRRTTSSCTPAWPPSSARS